MRERIDPRGHGGSAPRVPSGARRLAESGAGTVSSDELAEAAGVNSRRSARTSPSSVPTARRWVRRRLPDPRSGGSSASRRTGRSFGIGNLGQALANYGGFAEQFRVVALVDADPARMGERIGDLRAGHVDDLPRIVEELDVAIGVIATPAAPPPRRSPTVSSTRGAIGAELRTGDDAGAAGVSCARSIGGGARSWRSTSSGRRRSRR